MTTHITSSISAFAFIDIFTFAWLIIFNIASITVTLIKIMKLIISAKCTHLTLCCCYTLHYCLGHFLSVHRLYGLLVTHILDYICKHKNRLYFHRFVSIIYRKSCINPLKNEFFNILFGRCLWTYFLYFHPAQTFPSCNNNEKNHRMVYPIQMVSNCKIIIRLHRSI